MKPTREEAEEAVKTLIKWAGEDPERSGLLDTPKRVVKAYEEFFAGYKEDPKTVLECVFDHTENCLDPVLVRNISFFSHCEHHLVPIIGKAHVAYVPNGRLLGLSKIGRLVDIFAKRMQTQERLTAEISDAIMEYLCPRGVAVMIEAEHMCMSSRGVQKIGASTITTVYKGVYLNDSHLRDSFSEAVKL